MSVHYKFKSSLNYDTVTFDGLHISVTDLKKAIMQQKKIGKSSDFDLEITNAQTKQVYNNDEDLIPKNTSVIVCRIPVASRNKKSWERPELPLPIDNAESSGSLRFDRSIKSADLANSNNTEDDKVKIMFTQSSQEYDPSQYVRSRTMTGPLPPTYTCFRCGKQGHWIKNCPTNDFDVKRSTGIPRSFMLPVDGPEHKGALLTTSGGYAVPLIDHQAYKEVKKEKPPFVAEPDAPAEPTAEIPDELLCMLCRNLLQHAVLIPCCANSFCDDCIRQALIESSNHECPVCHEFDILPNTVIPNRFLRTAVANFNGDTEVRRNFSAPQTVEVPKIESPQPSPDSTVETQGPAAEHFESKTDAPAAEADDGYNSPVQQQVQNTTKKEEVDEEPAEEILELTQPGTPLADELEEDMTQPLPIETVGRGQYDDYQSGPHSHKQMESYGNDSPPDHCQINVITITTRQTNFQSRLPSMSSRQNYSSGHHRLDRSEYEHRDRPGYHRYDRRNNADRPPHGRNVMRNHPRYERQGDMRYNDHQDYPNYKMNRDHGRDYGVQSNMDMPRRRPRYPSPPPTSQLPVHPPYAPEILGTYPQAPVSIPPLQQPAPLLPLPQPSFPPQPPPPGASPIDTLSHIPPQPPPPGVGPLLSTPPSSQDSESATFISQPFKVKETKPQTEEQSIDDRIEAFQRELEKRDREAVRERSRSSSRSRTRNRSRSSSRSSHRSYNSSKSWTRSGSRSLSRSRSRSRSTYSSRRSRSRSFSRSRSHSRSKSRSLSRSRSKSRSRSRERRRTPSRERLPTPFSRSHSASHSPSPRNFHSKIRRPQYPPRRNINPPPYTSGYTPQYTAPPSIPIPTPYPPVHIQSIHTIPPSPITHQIDHYPPERQRYPYPGQYNEYGAYQHPPKPYDHPRFERDSRGQRFEGHGYHRRVEEMHHRIPGWVGDRNRQEQKQRFRPPREQQRKEIKELPKVPQFQIMPVRTQKAEVRVKENRDESKKRDDRKEASVKHKKHNHHRRSKEIKRNEKHESKPAVYESKAEQSKETVKLVAIEVLPEKVTAAKNELKVKSLEKKEKKHKHKKHKLGDENVKERKEKVKKEKGNSETATGKVKVKRKKNKAKAVVEGKKERVANKKLIETVNVTATKGENVDAVRHEAEDSEACQLQISHDDKITTNIVEPMDTVEQETEVIEEQVALDSEAIHAVIVPEDAQEPETPSDNMPSQDVAEDSGKEIEDVTEDSRKEVEDVAEDSGREVEDAPEEISEDLQDEEEEDEEDAAAEDVLRVEVPELSKWEREEFEDDSLSRPMRKSTVRVSRDKRGPLSSDIIQRAEKVILQKPLRTAILVPSNKEKVHKSDKISIKSESVHSSSTVRAKFKEAVESKPVATTEKTVAPTLQVTILTDKDKRSVQTKENAKKDASRGESHSKRVKLDRSHFTNVAPSTKTAPTSHRTVVVEQSSAESRRHEDKQRAESGSKRHYEETKTRGKVTGVRKDDYTYSTDHSRESHYRDRKHVTEDRRQREFHDSRRQPERYERYRHNPSDQTSSRDRHYTDIVESYRNEDRRDTYRRRSPSSSSSGSYENHKHHSRKIIEHQYDSRLDDGDNYDRSKISRKAESPVARREPEKKAHSKREASSRSNTRHISHDESKFEPDYDEFSEDEPETKVVTVKHKRPSEGPESVGKRLKHDKVVPSSNTESKKHHVKKSSSPSSVTSSSPSDSESSEMDTKITKSKISDADHKQKHKKSRHKKHKKHKHKHKKKKSHKSKQKD